MKTITVAHDIEPDSWRPGVFQNFNQKGLREDHEKRWGHQADVENSDRSVLSKLGGKGKVTANDIMRDEANAENAEFNTEYPKVPYAQRGQKIGEAILSESGIDPKTHFATDGELYEALAKSEIPFWERVDAAVDRVDGEQPKG